MKMLNICHAWKKSITISIAHTYSQFVVFYSSLKHKLINCTPKMTDYGFYGFEMILS